MKGDCPKDKDGINTLFDEIDEVKETVPSLDKREIHNWWHFFTDCEKYNLAPY